MTKNNILDKSFNLALLIKFIDGILDFIGGILLLILSPPIVSRFITLLFASELGESPQDYLIKPVSYISQHLSIQTQEFIAAYLLIHGIIKILTVLSIRNKSTKAHILSLVLLLGFVFYQLLKFVHSHSLYLLFLIVLDSSLIAYMLINQKKLLHK